MKRIILSLILFCATLGASAQMTDYTHNLQFSIGGGIHSLLYTPAEAQYHLGFGPLLQAQYQVMVNRYIGFGIGLQGSYLNASATYNYTQVSPTIQLPGTSVATDVSTRYYKWQEHQQLGYMALPLQLILRAPIGARRSIQCGLGMTINHPFTSTFNTTSGAYIRQTLTPLPADEQDNPLLGAHNDIQSGTFLTASTTADLAADLGVAFNISHATALYLGLYAIYHHHNILPESTHTAPLFTYDNNAQQYHYSSTFASDRVQTVTPLQCGVKIALRIGTGHFIGWRAAQQAAQAAAAQAHADSVAAAQEAERARLAEEQRLRNEAVARARAEAEAQARRAADSIAAIHAAELARARAEAEAQAAALAQARAQAEAQARAAAQAADSLARAAAQAEAQAQAEAEARARAEAEAALRAKAEQRAREEAAFIAGFSDTAHFETGKDMPIFAALNADSWDNLKSVMDSHTEINVRIVGHTDNVGSPKSNKALSQRRADNIKNMLVLKGIDATRITATGVGQEQPVAPNTTPAGRAQNRCIIITIGK
ncbi:MAG: OmpA family protein [Bacteroidales bacterium]|nr:OmpA family protein [Bacteroidales bacterium]